MTTLFAWANGLEFTAGIFDHTFVTDYDFKNNQYPKTWPTGGNYWYCWGEYHPSADHGNIGTQTGDDTIASGLVTPNVAPPSFPGGPGSQDGAIEYYGIDGVCHIVANQVLFATGTATIEPFLVEKARGYRLSSFLYTDYGLNTDAWKALRSKYAPNSKIPSDSFDGWLATLGFSMEDVLEVAVIRAATHEALLLLRTKIAGMTATEAYLAIGAEILIAMEALKKLLGVDDLKKLFPSLKSIPISAKDAAFIIDPDQLDYSLKKLNA